ncbi:PREDICTED: melanoma-associated antigen 8-like [Condylura cristata]|uniref:melanoma-associated antigen 8-like n=1 Tax=Condylura cristata TaxID=143302 RepID=UPI000643441A|nr:PREDICTED: melanoma-associated antigen 8-like [Condylura cristata]
MLSDLEVGGGAAMSQHQESELLELEEEAQEPGEAESLQDDPLLKLPWGEMLEQVTPPASPPTNPCPSVLVGGNQEEAAPGTPGAPQCPAVVSSSPRVLAAPLNSPCQEMSASSQGAEQPSTSQEAAEAQAPPQAELHGKMADLVWFLLLKYRAKEQTSRAEMLREVLPNDQGHFPEVFSQACECMQVVFGIDVTKAEPRGHTYVLNTTLGLTHNGLLSPEETMPKTGLLVYVLGVVLLDGDCASEEHVWKALNGMGVYAGSKHFIFGEPRELLTDVWVREQYLEYRQVAGSDPPRYEFLWGPRAHAEANVVDAPRKLREREQTSPTGGAQLTALCVRCSHLHAQHTGVQKHSDMNAPCTLNHTANTRWQRRFTCIRAHSHTHAAHQDYADQGPGALQLDSESEIEVLAPSGVMEPIAGPSYSQQPDRSARLAATLRPHCCALIINTEFDVDSAGSREEAAAGEGLGSLFGYHRGSFTGVQLQMGWCGDVPKVASSLRLQDNHPVGTCDQLAPPPAPASSPKEAAEA